MKILGKADIVDYLKFDLRIDPETIAGLNRETLKKIGAAYNKKSVTALVDWIEGQQM